MSYIATWMSTKLHVYIGNQINNLRRVPLVLLDHLYQTALIRNWKRLLIVFAKSLYGSNLSKPVNIYRQCAHSTFETIVRNWVVHCSNTCVVVFRLSSIIKHISGVLLSCAMIRYKWKLLRGGIIEYPYLTAKYFKSNLRCGWGKYENGLLLGVSHWK